MTKTGGEYRKQAWEELRQFKPNAIGSLVLSILADINPVNILRDSAEKARAKGKKS